MSHTPGPWEEDLSADCEHMARMIADNPDWGAVATVSEDHGHVAYCHYSNARLIAAAPELLAALKEAYDALDYAQAQVDSDTDRRHLTRCRRKIKPVIDRAEGRSE